MGDLAQSGQSEALEALVDGTVRRLRAVLVANRAGPLTRPVVTDHMSAAWYEHVCDEMRNVLLGRELDPYRCVVRSALVGWWVDGRWCPTERIREHQRQMIVKRSWPREVVFVNA